MRTYLINGQNGAVGKIATTIFENINNLDINITKNADVLLHLASAYEHNKVIDSNIIYLQNTINYCLSNNIKNFVFFSSVSVYGYQDKLNIDEKTSYNQPSLYALSKLFAEEYLKSINKLNVLVLRLPAILTKDTNTYINRIFNDLKDNKEIILKNYDKIFNSFVSIDDICRFINKYDFSNKFEILNFASMQEVTLKEIVYYLKKLLNSQSNIILDDSNMNYYNLNIEKLINKYDFVPSSYDISLKNWLGLKNE